MLKLNIYVISWPGFHEKAAAIAKDLMLAHGRDLAVVYSSLEGEPEPKFPCRAIKRPQALFWADKFRACVDDAKSGNLMVIHADCTTASWNKLIARCRKAFEQVKEMGVWSPLISGSRHELKYVELSEIDGTDYAIVAQSDAIVFALAAPIVDRIRRLDYSQNLLGWGIDTIMNCCCHCLGWLSLIDRGVAVTHPQGSGYTQADAVQQFFTFIQQMTAHERAVYRFMQALSSARRRNG
jgi:hypothetical protein